MFRIITTILFVIMLSGQSFAADVYIQRGLFGFFFPNGVYTMEKDLKKQGHNVVFTCWQDNCTKDIIKKIETRKGKNFALVGHSMGGNAITQIANELNKKKIRVPYMAVFDAPIPSPIPGNVDRVDNFYQFDDWRDPVLKILSNRTVAKQYDQRKKYDHIAIAEAKENRERVYFQINKLGK